VSAAAARARERPVLVTLQAADRVPINLGQAGLLGSSGFGGVRPPDGPRRDVDAPSGCIPA
jgi:hypothetical protein